MAAWARTAILLAALLPGTTVAVANSEGGLWGIPREELFELGMDDAREQARLDERPIIVCLIPSRLNEREQARLQDEIVAGLLRGFHAVQVDEVRNRELFESFSASPSSPSFVVLAADGLELHRWCGWMPASRFATYVAEAVERNASYMARQPWDVPNYREPWEDEGFDQPEGGRVQALAASGQRVWCLQQDGVLLDLDPLQGETRKRLSIPRDLWTDLAADDDELYVLPYGWIRLATIKSVARVSTLGCRKPACLDRASMVHRPSLCE